MAKSKTEIHVTTVFDGELDYLAKKQDLEYNKDKVQSDRVPSGLCG